MFRVYVSELQLRQTPVARSLSGAGTWIRHYQDCGLAFNLPSSFKSASTSECLIIHSCFTCIDCIGGKVETYGEGIVAPGVLARLTEKGQRVQGVKLFADVLSSPEA